ncbi:MAG: TIGR01777 family oxidoreductase [Pseudomonadota bacterium]
MKILICGATGLIGSALVKSINSQHELTIISRSVDRSKKIFPQLPAYTWDVFQQQSDFVSDFDVIINLAGANIGSQRWTRSRKKQIVDSRVISTRCIAEACANSEHAPRILNASAIGIYSAKRNDDNCYTEASAINTDTNDFLSTVAQQWETALVTAETAKVSVVKLRFAVVLSKHGGALAKLLPAYKMGLGGKIGSGKQAFSWVSLTDVVRAIQYIIEHPDITGAVNIVAPEIVNQKTFSQTLAKILHRPAFFTMPAFVVKLLFGEMGEALILDGQRVKDDKLRQHGFHYEYPKLEAALTHELQSAVEKT